jgi:hypothetical protein
MQSGNISARCLSNDTAMAELLACQHATCVSPPTLLNRRVVSIRRVSGVSYCKSILVAGSTRGLGLSTEYTKYVINLNFTSIEVINCPGRQPVDHIQGEKSEHNPMTYAQQAGHLVWKKPRLF